MDKANAAVHEAERYLLGLCQAHNQVRHQSSRVHRDLLPELNSNTSSARKEFIQEFKTRPTNTGVTYSGGFWKDTDPSIARVQADIAFQVILFNASKH